MRCNISSKHALLLLVLLIVLPVLGWLTYRTCPCIVDELREDQTSSNTMRVTSASSNCAVFSVPSFWILPDETIGEISAVEYYELRRSRQAADEFFIGLRSMTPDMPTNVPREPRPVLRSKNKFAFRFQPAHGKKNTKIGGVRSISEEEWAGSESLPFFDTGGTFVDVDPRSIQIGDGDFVVFNGRQFPRHEKYSGFSSRSMVSVNEVFIAVPSHGGPDLPEGLRFSLIPDLWRRSETIDVYRVSTRTRVARIKGWTCIGGLGQPQHIVWQGDEFLTMPLDTWSRQILLCDFRGV